MEESVPLVRSLCTAALAACLVAALPAGAAGPGSAAPSIAMPSLDGSKGPVSLDRLRGRVVYVDFWASWCLPCRISMPTLDRLYRQHGPAGFDIVGVNKDASLSDAEAFLKKVPVSFTLVADSNDSIAKAFDVKTMPSGYLIDRKGVVRHVHGGFTRATATALEEEIARLLAEKP